MSIDPLRFTGISSFSEDFQAILDRSVSIASIPVRQLESYQQEILADKTALGAVSLSVSSLADSIRSLASLKDGGALSIKSNSSKVTAFLRSGAAQGTYLVSDVTSLAQTAVYTGISGLADKSSTPVDPDGSLTLLIDGASHSISLGEGENNLSGLRDAINAANLGVTAAIVDSGSGASRYYLTLTADQPGARVFELRTDAADPESTLISETRAGADAQFKLNGIAITSKENFIRGMIPNVDFVLNGVTQPSEQIEISVTSNRAPVTAALSSFVNAYNNLASTLSLHRGESAGSLAGSGVVSDLSRQMFALTGVSIDSAAGNLTALGVSLDRAGVMTLDASVIERMDTESFRQALEFLSSQTNGLASMATSFEQFSDPVNGFIQAESSYLNQANERYADQIAKLNDRILAMRESMMAKLRAADTLLATLQSQRTLLDASIESLNTVTNGRRKD